MGKGTTQLENMNTRKKITDKERLDLKGEIKSVETIEYSSSDNTPKRRKVELFDRIGDKREEKVYCVGNIQRIHYSDIYIYNELDNDKEIRRKYSNGQEAKSVFRYDEYNNMTALLEYNSKGNLEICSQTNKNTYDERGKLVLMRGYDYRGKLFVEITYRYDDYGNVIEAYSCDQKRFYRYDRNNKVRIMMLYSYDKDGCQTDKTIYKYYLRKMVALTYDFNNRLKRKFYSLLDKYGNRYKSYCVNADGEIYQEEWFRYKYDTHNNWISCIDEDGYIRERKIEYYKL